MNAEFFSFILQQLMNNTPKTLSITVYFKTFIQIKPAGEINCLD